LAEAAAVARNDTDAAILLVSSFAPTRRNRRALGNAPVVEFLFEPPGARAGRIASPAPRQSFVATTARIAHAVALRSGVRPPVLAHKPLPRIDAAVGTVDLEGDVSRAVETMREVPSVLALGALHGKKDLDLVARLPSLVPEGWAVVVAGDPQVDGVAVLAQLHAGQHFVPIVTVERSLARGEFERLLVCSTVVLIPQRAGEASMSGVLLDAIAACRPVVAPFDSSAGDVIEACGGGATFVADSPAAVRAAIERAASNTWSADAATWREHGLLASSEWSARVIAELERARSRLT
jgi:glycosyltransferase involved in cell wall biosynthesis